VGIRGNLVVEEESLLRSRVDQCKRRDSWKKREFIKGRG
jgi:hypothetical protein